MTAATCTALAELAREGQTELDKAISAWRQGAGANVRLWCGPGCGNCCSLTVNCTLAEVLAIRAVLDDPLRERLAAAMGRIKTHARQCRDARAFLTGYRAAVGACPFLDAGASCAIYDHRPLACRALLATRPPDWCGVNLAELPGFERNAFLASLDRSVVAFPTHYAAAPRELATESERSLILAMLGHAGFGVTGNLPVLVWLTGLDGAAEALTDGPAQFRQFLDHHDIGYPFLIQIETA